MSTLRSLALVITAVALVGCSGGTPNTSAPATPTPTAEVTTEAPPASQTPSSEPSSEPTAEASTSSEPTGTPTGTSSPSASTDPAEDAARYAAVVPSFEQYWAVVNETYLAGGAAEPTQGMRDTMTGNQLQYWTDAFAKFKEAENSYEGRNVVVYANPKSVALKPDGGEAQVEYCVDMSQTKAFDVDGRPLTKEGLFQKGTAGLLWEKGRWKVAGFLAGSGFVASC